MKTINIFDKEVSWFDSIYEKEPSKYLSLREVLLNENKQMKTLVEEYRKMLELENIEGFPEIESRNLKKRLPCFIPSGIFRSRTNEGLIEHNRIVCIDIDAKDNSDVENFIDLKDMMTDIPYVAYCAHSCSGKGYFVLIPIEQSEKHNEHFTSICDDFERCNIAVDRACINVSRTRTISFDHDAYINEDAQVYTRVKDIQKEYSLKEISPNISDRKHQYKIAKRKRTINLSWVEDPILYFKVNDVLSWIDKEKIDITKNEPQWHQIGIALADEFGEFGRDIFHNVSKYYPKYIEIDTDRKFDRCLTLFGYKIGSFFHYAKLNGYKRF